MTTPSPSGTGGPNAAHAAHTDALEVFVGAWTAALVDDRDFTPLSATEAEALVAGLADRLVAAVRSDLAIAFDVGMALVDAHITSTGALGRTLEVVAAHLLAAAGLQSYADANVSLGTVQGALAAGYLQAVRERTFAQQEAIRVAERDVRRRIEERLRASEARFRAVFAESGIGIGLADMDSDIIEANGAFAEMLGYTPAEFMQMRVTDFFAGGTAATVGIREVYAELLSGARDHVRVEFPFRHRDGSTVWTNLTVSLIRDADGAPRYTLAMAEDVTEQRLLRERLVYQARHDPLTGLANRILFFERLNAACERGDGRVGVCAVDLDGFKPINDTLGHDVGDDLLVVVARRLERCGSDGGHLVARMGGDEFVVLIEASTGIAQAQQVAAEALAAVAVPYDIAGHHLTLTASAGVVERPVAGTTPAELMKAADLTLYSAKRDGRGRYAAFDEEASRRESIRMTLAATLPAALVRGEFTLEYQPIVGLGDGTIRGVEALVRWMHPQLGRIAPDRFIGIAEDTGAIVPLGRWVLEEACRQLQRWRRDLIGSPLFVSVNLSVCQAREPDLADEIAAILDATDLPPDALWVELTESALMDPQGEPLKVLRALDDMGVPVAIDDFGTGYSNLAYLHSLPVRKLKLDGAFVRPGPSARSRLSADAITAALVPLAHDLGLEVVAEGVESAAQASRLRDLRCDLAQGWFFSPPAPTAEISDLLLRGSGSLIGYVR
jgi:diguanylate cyclase (GGDEF)-like protein/PAS domain S-box-containing protein